MRLSQLFAKTDKSAKEFASINATLLQKAGFIHQEMAGVYTFLPLGYRVLQKIEQIIREEMDTVAAEVLMPSLSTFDTWRATGRLDTVDVLMKASGANPPSQQKNDAEYILNCTHEDVVTPIAKNFRRSYKDFPFAVYQIQTKFRNEPRAKSGLLRGREFRMKDLYSFHVSEADLLEFYEKMKTVYWRVFERLGLKEHTVLTQASGGDFTENFSHEYQTMCATGEDTIFIVPSLNIAYNREVAPSQARPWSNTDEQPRPMEEIERAGVTGVENLVKELQIAIEQTTKTMLFEIDDRRLIAAAVRGDYDINEEKLRKIVGCTQLTLASAERILQETGAAVGYAGIVNLPNTITVYCDDSLKDRVNFECGGNRTNHHLINVNFGRDLPVPKQFYDLKTAQEGDYFPETGEAYRVERACEVGNIFPLNTKFSTALDYRYIDEHGQGQLVYMGSYGIGSSRIMGVLVEKFHDDHGMMWPDAVAPFDIHLITIGAQHDATAMELIQALQDAGWEMLWDDRPDVRPGEKFADADLFGIPRRLVISDKTGSNIEVKKRREPNASLIPMEELPEWLEQS